VSNKTFGGKKMSDSNAKYVPEIVKEDCTVYCKTCNKTIELKKGDPIPLCCGKAMEIID
jgi:hypothetical protein